MKTVAIEKGQGLIKCPVCDWPPTAEEVCPHCGTDLGPLWRLLSLPQRLYRLGEQLRQESPEGGLEYFTATAVIEPQSLSNRLALGQVLLAQERLTQALIQAEQPLAMDPENREALELKEQVLAAMDRQRVTDKDRQRALLEETEKKTASRWKRYTFAVSGLTLVTVMVLFMVAVMTTTGRKPFLAERGPSSREVATKVSGMLASNFPMLSVEATPEGVRLRGELATYRDLVRVREQLDGLPLLNYDGIKVKDEHFLTYRVRAGDSLTKLATKFYGQSSRWPLIHAANQERILNADLLQPGVLLMIPLIKE